MSPVFRDLNHNGTMEPYEDRSNRAVRGKLGGPGSVPIWPVPRELGGRLRPRG
jgi:hypothetical protein